jgi:hypothetical protein
VKRKKIAFPGNRKSFLEKSRSETGDGGRKTLGPRGAIAYSILAGERGRRDKPGAPELNCKPISGTAPRSSRLQTAGRLSAYPTSIPTTKVHSSTRCNAGGLCTRVLRLPASLTSLRYLRARSHYPKAIFRGRFDDMFLSV